MVPSFPFVLFFFFQAEDGIRDYKVTGVQTCALPISRPARRVPRHALRGVLPRGRPGPRPPLPRGARGAPSRPLLDNARRLTRARGRALTVVLAAALLAACVSLRAGAAGLVRITLLQINDVYVLGPVDGGHRGGMGRPATPVPQPRRENPHPPF